MKFIIVTTSRTFDIEKKRQIVGGVQTYTRDLCLLSIEKGFKAIMFELNDSLPSDKGVFSGIDYHVINKDGKSNQYWFERIYNEHNSPDAVFVIATDQMDIKTNANNVITIQHGIAFDCPIEEGFWSKTRILQYANKFIRSIKNVRRMNWNRNTVGVDYNYYNWYRTLGMIYPEKKFTVIPNYSSGCIDEDALAQKLTEYSAKKTRKVVFARRFCSYRGTLLFANCVERLLPLYPDIEFTFAGDGELREEIEGRFKGNDRVHITRFEAPDSIEFHRQFDIAVVPTIFSEGTSLSLLEAMSAGCFPIATHVGGMTNIILDHYNGLLCYPNEEGVYRAMVEAIEMSDNTFKSMVNNAYRSATEAFSLKQWQKRWSTVIDDVLIKQRVDAKDNEN